MDKFEALEKYFGYKSFRVGQEEIIDAIFDQKINGVLAVMPTSSGKSLLFQLPAVMSKNMTLVVSPLISLMKDQVDDMKRKGISSEFYNSSLSDEEKSNIISKLRNKEIKLLYVAPERFDDANFMEILKDNKISIFAVDESHCISTFSNFRPAYRKIRRAIFELKPGQVIGLTATATKLVQADICNQLGAPNAKRFILGFNRPDLKIEVVRCFSDRFDRVIDDVLCYHEDGIKTGIIYVGKRKDAESISNILKDTYNINVMFYHAGLEDAERSETQNKWMKNGGIIVATTSLGMGVNKPDVRFILHAYLPSSIEDYYQQIGRASRDGLGADCRIFTSLYEDTRFLNWMIDASYPQPDVVETFWKYVNREGKSNKGVIKQTQEEMALSAGIKPAMVGGCVGILKKNGLMETVERGVYNVNYFDKHDDAPLDYEALRALRKAQQEKMLEITGFVEDNKTCRMVKILDYFDDKGSSPCGKCDNCRKGKK